MALEDEKVIGFANGIYRKKLLPGETFEKEPGYITFVLVDNAYRGKGIGTLLLDNIELFLKNRDASSFEVKKIIFKYALILGNQPKVPIELFPKDWPEFRANLVYKKIRRLIT